MQFYAGADDDKHHPGSCRGDNLTSFFANMVFATERIGVDDDSFLDRIDFSDANPGEVFQSVMGHPPRDRDLDAPPTWTRGKESTLQTPGFPSDGSYVVRIIGQPFVVNEPLPTQDVVISVNGLRIGACTIRDKCLIEFEIPRTIKGVTNGVKIKLAIPGAVRPNKVTDSRDTRVLGFCLEKMVVIQYASQIATWRRGKSRES